MVNKIFIFLFLVFGCTASQSFKLPAEINLVEINNMHFVRVTLNDIDAMLLLDTGASKSLLDITRSEEYNFEYIFLSENHYIGLGGKQNIYVVYDYKIIGIWISFLGADLSGIQGYFAKDGIQIIGIIGSDFIKQYNVVIDFNTNKMLLK